MSCSPLHTMMSHLPIEFSLLPPTCKRNLIGCYSNLYSDKVAERGEKKKKILSHLKTLYSVFLPQPSICAGPPSQCLVTLWTAITPSRLPISTWSHPKVHSSFPLLLKLSLKSPVCGPAGCVCFHLRLPPPLEFKVLFCLRQGWPAIKTLLPLHKPPVIFFTNLPTSLLLPSPAAPQPTVPSAQQEFRDKLTKC